MNTIQKITLKFIKAHQNKKFYCKNYKSATPDWIKFYSGLPWLKLNLPVPYQIILNEIQNIQNYFVPHREDYNEHIGWWSFCIHGKSFDSTREEVYYKDDRPYKFTDEAITFMPNTVSYFKTTFIDTEFLRLRVMKLQPKGMITLHSDKTKPGNLHPINIAISQPSNCNFVIENFGTVPFALGDAYMLDVSNRHAVYNDSNDIRYHIIMHYKPSLFIDNLILQSYNTAYDNLHN